MDILHHWGLSGKFKSLFEGITIEQAIKDLEESKDKQYLKLINFLREYIDNQNLVSNIHSDIYSEVNLGDIREGKKRRIIQTNMKEKSF